MPKSYFTLRGTAEGKLFRKHSKTKRDVEHQVNNKAWLHRTFSRGITLTYINESDYARGSCDNELAS